MSVYFVDTDGELLNSLIDEQGVQVIKMPYYLGANQYYDYGGEVTDYYDFYSQMRNGVVAKTAALNESDYIEYFKPYFEKGEEIFYCAFSSKMSATFESMHKAVDQLSKQYPKAKFTYFDTLSISMGAGFMMYYGAKKWNAGATTKQLVEYLTDLRQHVSTLVVVDDLVYLKRGGRVSPTMAFVGGVLGIKPVLKIVDNGTLEKVDTIKGSKKVLGYLFDNFQALHNDIENYDVWIMHADCIEQAQMLKDMINDKYSNTKVNVQMIGPVVGAHAGPGTLAIIFNGIHR